MHGDYFGGLGECDGGPPPGRPLGPRRVAAAVLSFLALVYLLEFLVRNMGGY